MQWTAPRTSSELKPKISSMSIILFPDNSSNQASEDFPSMLSFYDSREKVLGNLTSSFLPKTLPLASLTYSPEDTLKTVRCHSLSSSLNLRQRLFYSPSPPAIVTSTPLPPPHPTTTIAITTSSPPPPSRYRHHHQHRYRVNIKKSCCRLTEI